MKAAGDEEVKLQSMKETSAVSLLRPGLPSWTIAIAVSSELFVSYFFLIFRFCSVR